MKPTPGAQECLVLLGPQPHGNTAPYTGSDPAESILEKLRSRQECQAIASSLSLTEPNPVSVGDWCGLVKKVQVSEMHLQSDSDSAMNGSWCQES